MAGEASLCALGKTAPNPFLSTLRYFRDEYEAHIKEKRCPALSCKELIAYYIDPGEVQGLHDLPQGSARRRRSTGGKNRIHVIDQEKCTKCGTCFEVCPPRFGAVTKTLRRARSASHPRRSKNHGQREQRE